MKRLALIAIALVAASSQAKGDYLRYRVYPQTMEEASRITNSPLGLFSDDVRLGETDIYVAPGQLAELWKLRLPYQFVQKISATYTPPELVDSFDYRNVYLRYPDIIAQYEEWRTENPGVVERVQIGRGQPSLNNPIYAYRVFKPQAQDVAVPPKSIVLTFGIHAREWVSPACGLHITRKLIDELNAGTSPIAQVLTDNCAVYVIPVLNPDGYLHTWTSGGRLWRKNRRNNGNGTYGVDLNRNFSIGWGGGGSSGNTSSETYRGPSAFSEPETSALRNFCLGLPNLRGFIDYHSYAEKILWPWSYLTSPPPDVSTLSAIASQMITEMVADGGHTYQHGQGSVALYIASGTTKDYFYSVHDAISYTIELRDTGAYGFLLPEDQIAGTQDEAWAALKRLILGVL
ncbi:MAG TPA: M14 family zinc carboxypeptidase [Fimbriimonadaceae bacterium]|nr:M14 family zinc carboxypeptidase [Fimbriimonadaceae bacterium]